MIAVGFSLTRAQIVELAENISQTLRDLKQNEKSNINKNAIREDKRKSRMRGKVMRN
jgi:hypothetical protein